MQWLQRTIADSADVSLLILLPYQINLGRRTTLSCSMTYRLWSELAAHCSLNLHVKPDWVTVLLLLLRCFSNIEASLQDSSPNWNSVLSIFCSLSSWWNFPANSSGIFCRKKQHSTELDSARFKLLPYM